MYFLVAEDGSDNEWCLGAPAVAGIVIGVVFFLLLCVAVLYWFQFKSNGSK